MKKALMFIACLALSAATFGADIFVSQTTGKKKGPGTKEAPYKAMFDALKKAQPGDVIHVAQGTYTGAMGASVIAIEKPVSIIGGYAPDFSSRDIVKFPTMIQPKNEKNDTKQLGILMIQNLNGGAGTTLMLDGLVIDQGFMNSYHDVKGKPEGVETGMWLEPPAHGSKDKFASAKSYSVYAETKNRYEGTTIIQNCIFANGGNFAICLSQYKGEVKILNNVFVANRMEACDVSCASAQPTLKCEFAYNTVLFTWSRTDDFGDMGYGFRCMSKVTSNIHHNLFGLNVFAGVGNDKGDSKTKNISLDNNVFFLNKRADVTAVQSPNIINLKVGTDEFDDLADFPGMTSVEDNVALQDPAAFKGRINEAYLVAFLNASYSEKLDYDENSPANVFRAAMGMNKVGKIETKVSMYGNRYPLADCFKLFGAGQGFGAQLIK